jgi:hypothetical protein
MACRSGPARCAACRPVRSTPAVKRRSDDLSCPTRPWPDSGAEQAGSECQAELEPAHLSSHHWGTTQHCRAEAHTAAQAGAQSLGTWTPAAPVHPNLPNSGRCLSAWSCDRSHGYSHAEASASDRDGLRFSVIMRRRSAPIADYLCALPAVSRRGSTAHIRQFGTCWRGGPLRGLPLGRRAAESAPWRRRAVAGLGRKFA